MAFLEHSSFKNVFDHLLPNTLLVLDLDNTLIESALHYGSYQWANNLIKEAVSQGRDLDEVIDQIIPLWEETQYQVEIRCIEQELVDYFKELHQREIKLLGVTGRSPKMAPLTIKKLKQCNIQFSDWSQCLPQFNQSESVCFEEGIIFVGPKGHKGHALSEFLNQITHSFSRLIFIDDQPHYLKQVHDCFSDGLIKFLGIRYSGADKRVKQFDPKIAEMEKNRLLNT